MFINRVEKEQYRPIVFFAGRQARLEFPPATSLSKHAGPVVPDVEEGCDPPPESSSSTSLLS